MNRHDRRAAEAQARKEGGPPMEQAQGPKPMAGINIVYMEDGTVQITTTTFDRVVIAGILERAKHMLFHQKAGEDPKIVVPKDIPPDSFLKGGKL